MKGIVFAAGLIALCAAGARAQDITGKVAETMDSGGYTYARVAKGEASTWVAVPQMKLKKGDAVAFQPGMVMVNFESKTLHRTFDKIVFSGGPAVKGASAAAGKAAGGKPHAGAPEVKKDAALKIEKAAGPSGFTVQEVYAKRGELSGQKISVHGKVVKVNHAIMNRNWIHLQDGTGDSKKGDFDLLVTTNEEAKVGETVTAQGTVAKDQDFGMGYKYSVLLEKSTLNR